MRWTSANLAIAELIRANLVANTASSARPTYKLDRTGDLIWMPNAVIDGIADETPPVTKLRQTQDPMALRLFVELYGSQNLREDGGISPKIVYQRYERKKLGQRSGYCVWKFTLANSSVVWGPLTTPHRRNELTPEEQANGKNQAVDFFERWQVLESTGLVEWVPYLYEGPDGEPIHPLAPDSSIEIERKLYQFSEAAARRYVVKWGPNVASTDLVAVVEAHISQVAVVGIARLRYRPRTSLTSSWWANLNELVEKHRQIYVRLAGA